LFQHDDYDPRLLFPRLLGGLVHPAVAAGVLDLANFLTRRHRFGQHPAAGHVQGLASLLGGVVGRLGQLGIVAAAKQGRRSSSAAIRSAKACRWPCRCATRWP
jgi:hypothetical protein